MSENETRIFIRDYINDENSFLELVSKFDLSRCENCENYELDEDLHDTAWGRICESCRNDIDI